MLYNDTKLLHKLINKSHFFSICFKENFFAITTSISNICNLLKAIHFSEHIILTYIWVQLLAIILIDNCEQGEFTTHLLLCTLLVRLL